MRGIIAIGALLTCSTMAHAAVPPAPTTELHLHLGGAFPLDYLEEIASEQDYQHLTSRITDISGGVMYAEAFDVFGRVSRIMHSDERIQEGTARLIQKQADEGVTHVELRTSVKDLGSGKESYVIAVLTGMERGMEKSGITATLLLSLRRTDSPDHIEATIDLAQKFRFQGVTGIDISGNATEGSIDLMLPAISRIKEHDLAITLHIGEYAGEAGQLELLEAIQPNRVGHAVHLEPEALEWIRQHKTPIEMCLSSSVLVKMVDDAAEHPGIQLLREGHPVVLCTDDPLIFDTTLEKEYALLRKVAPDLTHDDLQALSYNAVRFRF